MTQANPDCRVDVVFGEAYRQLVEGTPLLTALDDLCLGLADALDMDFLWLGELQNGQDSKQIALRAASHSGKLRDQLGEHLQGLASSAADSEPSLSTIETGKPAFQTISAKAQLAWYKTAYKKGIRGQWAIALKHAELPNPWVIVFTANKAADLKNRDRHTEWQEIATRLRRLLPAALRCQQNQLVHGAMQAA
ncbi:MAG: hypothetical protein R3352_07915, partial [Salinisphaeraceae bacterium]|nr:hypothetical protein [Salinisphaeraceae bacterium]